MELTEPQWRYLEKILPKPEIRSDGRGRPWRDPRDVLEGVLWILRSGARWKDLPKDIFPSYQTCHRRFQGWVEDGTIVKILEFLAEDLRDRGKVNLLETYIDGSFAPAKKGARKSAKPSAARGPRSWQLRTAQVFLSQLGLKVLHRMRLRLLKQQSSKNMSAEELKSLSEIKPTTVIRLMNEFAGDSRFNLLLLTRQIAENQPRKTEGPYDATADDGKWSDSLPG